MTPAEKLAACKQRKRPPRNTPKTVRAVKVRCNLRAKRESLNLSLLDVAKATGMSVSTLHYIEYGGDCVMTSALKLKELFGCELGELWQPLKKPRKK